MIENDITTRFLDSRIEAVVKRGDETELRIAKLKAEIERLETNPVGKLTSQLPSVLLRLTPRSPLASRLHSWSWIKSRRSWSVQ